LDIIIFLIMTVFVRYIYYYFMMVLLTSTDFVK
jgi:hypothetical protein